MAFQKTKLQEKENSYNRENVDVSELYAIHLQNEEPAFYGRTPGILHYLTYIVETKKGKERRNLSADACFLYLYFKQIAGSANSPIFQSREKICKRIRCKKSKYYELIEELSQKFEQLNGKSLIVKTEARKTSQTKKGEKRVQKYNQYQLTNIWPENNAYMATLKYHEELEIGQILDDFEDESGEETSRPQIRTGSDIPSANADEIPKAPFRKCGRDPLGDYESANNNPSFTKNPSVKEQQPPTGCDCNSQNQDPVTGFALEKEKAEKAMRASGCDENLITELLKKYTPQQINQAGYYVQQQSKKKPIKNLVGYFRRAVEKGWKWKETSKAKKKTD